jgi:hypothetical protein
LPVVPAFHPVIGSGVAADKQPIQANMRLNLIKPNFIPFPGVCMASDVPVLYDAGEPLIKPGYGLKPAATGAFARRNECSEL